MIAMQYRFHLPADYDMNLIRQRIHNNGARLNGFPDLVAKLYLYASRDEQDCPSQHNLYAPFYLWQQPAGMQRFLHSDGFAALCAHFGQPQISIWLPQQETDVAQLMQQTAISLGIRSLDHPLPASDDHLLAAWNPQSWQTLQIRPVVSDGVPAAGWQNYRVAYVASGDHIA